MKKSAIIIFSISIILLISIVWYYNANSQYVVHTNDILTDTLIENTDMGVLSDDEVAGLILMREEEKLARDIYLTLYDKWNLPMFNNIANSEQTHTDAVKTLLDRYNISDPVSDDTIGIFTSPLLQNIYDTFVAEGSLSLLDALIIGATVEDMDIKDLNQLLQQTDNEDIIITYNNLNRGSRNHLRAFYKQIQSNGGMYTPQYISEAEFDNIIGSSQEKGNGRVR